MATDMLAVILYCIPLALTTTAGLYVFLSGPGPARNTPKHRKGH